MCCKSYFSKDFFSKATPFLFSPSFVKSDFSFLSQTVLRAITTQSSLSKETAPSKVLLSLISSINAQSGLVFQFLFQFSQAGLVVLGQRLILLGIKFSSTQYGGNKIMSARTADN